MRCKAGLLHRRTLPAPNPPFSSVVALLHLNGTTGTQSATDSSSLNKTISFSGAVTIRDYAARFGSAGLQFNGEINERVVVQNSAVIGTSDFTIEFFINVGVPFIGEINFARWASGFEVRLSDSLYVARVSTTPFSLSTYDSSAKWTPQLGVWYHVAVCRNQSSMKLFVDGQQLGKTVNLGSGFSFPSGNQQFGSTSGLASHIGYTDEIRVSLVDIYSSYAPFLPPSDQFPDA